MKRFFPKHRLFGWLKASKSSALAAACAATTATAAVPPPVPAYIRNLMSDGDTLLAFREQEDLFGSGRAGAVVAIRHPPDEGTSWENNPCDLVVLRKRENEWVETVRTNKVVNCIDNPILPFVSELMVNDYLKLEPQKFSFRNGRAKGGSVHTFKLNEDSTDWYLTYASDVYSSIDDALQPITVVLEASYPGALPRTPLHSMDPDSVAQIIGKHPKTYRD